MYSGFYCGWILTVIAIMILPRKWVYIFSTDRSNLFAFGCIRFLAEKSIPESRIKITQTQFRGNFSLDFPFESWQRFDHRSFSLGVRTGEKYKCSEYLYGKKVIVELCKRRFLKVSVNDRICLHVRWSCIDGIKSINSHTYLPTRTCFSHFPRTRECRLQFKEYFNFISLLLKNLSPIA